MLISPPDRVFSEVELSDVHFQVSAATEKLNGFQRMAAVMESDTSILPSSELHKQDWNFRVV